MRLYVLENWCVSPQNAWQAVSLEKKQCSHEICLPYCIGGGSDLFAASRVQLCASYFSSALQLSSSGDWGGTAAFMYWIRGNGGRFHFLVRDLVKGSRTDLH